MSSHLPSPTQVLAHPISLLVFGLFGVIWLWESRYPGRSLPTTRGWRVRALLMSLVFLLLSAYLPFIWDDWLAKYSLLDFSRLSLGSGTALGVLFYQTTVYLWHRAMHRSNILFRCFHQLHHSAERIDVFASFFFGPLDAFGWSLLGSLSLIFVLGLDPTQTALALFISSLLGIFQHSNIRTPMWLGYIIQRPESHSIHHQTGVHAYNYSDLPLVDIVFGTFQNPEEFSKATGFYPGASSRILDAILCKDITRRTK